MLLLTGATGLVGSALLPRLLAEEVPVRCLVRDPRRLGANRVRVQIALGDLADPRAFRNAMRGVDTVVHLAASTRDQPRGSIEELCAMATWRMLDAAARAEVRRFVYFSALGASPQHHVRLLRAKAAAERLVRESPVPSTVIAPSLIYAPGDRWLKLIERLARLPLVPIPGTGRARSQPIWARDVADCVLAALRAGAEEGAGELRYELAGPDTLTANQLLHTILRAAGRERPVAHLPGCVAVRALHALGRMAGQDTPVTWDEAELLRAECISTRGDADARALGVSPQQIELVLGLLG